MTDRPASKTIAEMTESECLEAFKDEVLAILFAPGGDEQGGSSIDDEEKGLIEVLLRVYGLPRDKLLALEKRGRRLGNLDQQLGVNVIRRLLETKHYVLQNSEFERVVGWLRFRTGVRRSDPDQRWWTQMSPLVPHELTQRSSGAAARTGERTPGIVSSDSSLEDTRSPETFPAGPVVARAGVGNDGAGPPPAPALPEPEIVDCLMLRSAVEEGLQRLQRDGSRIMRRIREAMDGGCFVTSLCAFGETRLPAAPQILVVGDAELAKVPEVWFAGDVHGDLLAFEAVCRTFEEQSREGSKLVFLGDLVDDGFHGQEVVLAIWEKMLDSPGRYGWLAGNHDEGLRWSTEAAAFISLVSPADFKDWLNERLGDSAIVDLGKMLVRVVAELPRALFLPGLFAAHAGFPHSDTWAHLKTPEDMGTLRCLGDFVWNRCANARLKLPNRTSSQSSFGSEDFRGFRLVCARLGLRVDGMVRGHDHVDERVERWERKEAVPRGSFEGRVLTINTLSYTQRRETSPFAPRNPRSPTLARWRSGESLPTPVVVKIRASDVEWYAPVCATCGRPNRTWASSCEYVVAGPAGAGRCGASLSASSRA